MHTGQVATAYADVLARNARAARARAGIDQATVARRMSNLGFGAWVRQTVTKVERGGRRLTAEEVLGLSIALQTTVAALLMPANEDNAIILPAGGIFDGHAIQTSVMGYSPAAFYEPGSDKLMAAPTRMLPGSEPPGWPPVTPLRGARADRLAAEAKLMTEPSAEAPRPPVVAAIVTSDLGVLVGRRNDRTPPWGFIAGEVEPGEQPEDAAVREVKEETGLEIQAGEIIGERDHPATGRHMIYMAGHPTHGTKVFVGDEAELAQVRWVGLAEADELLPGMYEPVREYLAATIGPGSGS